MFGPIELWLRVATAQAELIDRFCGPATAEGSVLAGAQPQDPSGAKTNQPPVDTILDVAAGEQEVAKMLHNTEEDFEHSQLLYKEQLGELVVGVGAAQEEEIEVDSAVTKSITPSTVPRMLPYPELGVSDPRIGFSACLLGHSVRYNGGHCNARTITESLSNVFKFVPVCPEMDLGLGVPRPTIRLVSASPPSDDIEDILRNVRLWCPDESKDLTQQMQEYCTAKIQELRGLGLDAFILKKDSPSCGIDRVRIHSGFDVTDPARRIGAGMFASALMEQWPELPATDETQMNDEDVRNSFLQAALCHAQWRQHDGSFSAVVEFHERHKYILMAQVPQILTELGRELAKGLKHFLAHSIQAVYYARFFAAMKVPVGRGHRANVLRHLCGMLRNDVDADMYGGLMGAVEDYKEGLVPLVVPLKLLHVLLAGTVDGEQVQLKELHATSEYINNHPRSQRAYDAISNRTLN